MAQPACRGFTYLTVLFIVAFMGVGMMAIGTMWQTARMRERETELLFVGNAYKRAIELYYRAAPRYPRTLEELVKDPRQPSTQRYLRRLYPDPMTGSSEWGIVKSPDGGVMGVYSKSEEEPIKKNGFKLREAGFESAKTYADWKFMYTPQAAAQKPAAGAPTPGAPQPQIPTPPAPTPTPAAAAK